MKKCYYSLLAVLVFIFVGCSDVPEKETDRSLLDRYNDSCARYGRIMSGLKINSPEEICAYGNFKYYANLADTVFIRMYPLKPPPTPIIYDNTCYPVKPTK